MDCILLRTRKVPRVMSWLWRSDHQTTSLLAKMIIPALTIGDPSHHLLSPDESSTLASPVAKSPLEEVQLVNGLCDPLALKLTQCRIADLGRVVLSVQRSFRQIIHSIEAMSALNALKRYQLRRAIRLLPQVQELSKVCIIMSYLPTIISSHITTRASM
jgi:hypothetical protein